MAVLASICLLHSLKSWHYVAGRLQSPDVQFLFTVPWWRQVRAWAAGAGVILLPLVALCAYAMVVGFVFNYWLVPVLLPPFLLLLAQAAGRQQAPYQGRAGGWRPALPLSITKQNCSLQDRHATCTAPRGGGRYPPASQHLGPLP